MVRQSITLSIILSAYNSELTLPDTLQSLHSALDGDFSDCELLLINDASDDATPALLRDFARDIPQARVIDLACHNIGEVRQFAIQHSHGEYITILDSDDLLKAGSLTEILPFLRQHAPDMLITKLHEVRELAATDTRWAGLRPETLSTEQAIKRFLIHKDFQAHLIGQFIKTAILRQVTIPAYRCYEDFYAFPEVLLKSQKIFYSKVSHYLYLKHEGSLSNSPSSDKIDNLIVCTGRLDTLFGPQYHHLITCHWVDIKLKQSQWIARTALQHQVDRQSRRALSAGYFLDPSVRLSYKKRALTLLWKK